MKPIDVVRAVGTVLVFLNMFLGWIVAWLLQTIAKAVMFPFSTPEQRGDVCGRIFRTVNMIVMDLLNPFWCMNQVRCADRSKLPKDRPVIYMINHLSNSDPWGCIRVIWPVECKWICKGSLFKIPFGGWALKNNNDLAVKFTSAKGGWGTEKGSVKSLMDDAASNLRRLQPIAVFPEGVRSFNPDGPVGEFKAGFFDLAIKENALIVPVALSGTEKWWPRGDWKLNRAQAYSSVGDAIDPQTLGSTEELMAKVHSAITELREQHPDRVALRKSQ